MNKREEMNELAIAMNKNRKRINQGLSQREKLEALGKINFSS